MKNLKTFGLLLILSFGVTGVNSVYGQNPKQNYNGKFKHIYSEGIAQYQYFENEQGEWIPDGFFLFDEAFGNYKIKGQYISGRKSGNWVYTTNSTTITYSFNNGLLNGQWKSVYNYMTRSESIIANFDNGRLVGKFSIDKIADDWGWDANVTGQFNDNGFLDGLWVVKYGEKIPREAKFIFKHGVLINYFDRDLSTGELEKHSNVTYPYCNFHSTDNDTIIKSSVFWDNFNNYDGTSFVVNNSGDTIYYERVDNERCGNQLLPSNIISKIIFENMSKKAHIFSKNGSIIDDRESPSFSTKISGIIKEDTEKNNEIKRRKTAISARVKFVEDSINNSICKIYQSRLDSLIQRYTEDILTMKEEFGKLYGTSYRTYFSYFDGKISEISYYHSRKNSIKEKDRGSNCKENYKTVKDEIDKINMRIPQELVDQKKEVIQDKIKYVYKDELENELKKNGKYFVDEIELYEAFINKDYKQILKEKKKKK